MSSDLPRSLARLFEHIPKSGADISIPLLYMAFFDAAETDDAQQRLGPYITRLNRRLRERRLRIVPGIARRSYRLARL